MKFMTMMICSCLLYACVNVPVVEDLGNGTYATSAFSSQGISKSRDLAFAKAERYCLKNGDSSSVIDVQTTDAKTSYVTSRGSMSGDELKQINVTFRCE